MAAVAMRLRAELRSWGSGFLLLVLVLALGAGAAAAAAAGARRSLTAYDRLLRWSKPPDVITGGWNGEPGDQATMLRRLARLPQVADSVVISAVFGQTRLDDGTVRDDIGIGVERSGRFGRTPFGRAKVLEGRFPDLHRAGEAAMGFASAEKSGLRVGDHISVLGSNGRRVARLHLVGIVAVPGQLPSATNRVFPFLSVGPAFAHRYPGLFQPGNDSLALRAAPGVSAHELAAKITQVSRDQVQDLNVQTENTIGVQHLIQTEAATLWWAAALLGALTLVLLTMLMVRQASGEASAMRTLGRLGMTRRGIAAVGAARGAVSGTAAAVGTILFAAALSVLTPVGVARIAEPYLGWYFDTTVLALTAASLLVVCVGVGALAAVSTALRPKATGRARAGRLPSSRLPVIVGLELARDAGGPTGRRVARLGTLGIAALVTAATMTAVVLASAERLFDHPALAGSTFDSVLSYSKNPERAMRALRHVAGIEATTRGGWVQLRVNDRAVYVQIVGDTGTIQPAVARGRAPRRAGEIALGAAELRALGRSLGDRVHLRADHTRTTARVVGELVAVSPIYRTIPTGRGGAITSATVERLGIPLNEAAPSVLVKFAPGNDRFALASRIAAAARPEFAFDVRRDEVASLRRVTTVPTAVLGALAGLGVFAVCSLLVVAARRRRHDLAVLRALGMSRSQVRRSVLVQATVTLALALGLGIGPGLVLGHLAWKRAATSLGVVPSTAIEAVIVVGAIAVAALAALVGATLAARTALAGTIARGVRSPG